MTPQEIALEAARRILVKSPVTQQHLEEAVDYNAALILTAAAKMVRESGAVEALEHAQELVPTQLYLSPSGELYPAKDACSAALTALRALTDQAGKP